MFVYHGSASGLAPTAAWTAESDQGIADFGNSVATAGDVNGDGYSDVIVGARTYDNGETDEGRAFIYLGSASGLAPTAAWTAESDQTDAFFGWSVATAGDVNGDGYSDVIVGATGYDNGQIFEGGAFVYLGSASGLAPAAAWTAESDRDWAYFGCSVATAGDVNGDGYSDVIVGAYLRDSGQTEEGRAFVYLGSTSGLAPAAAWTAESDQDNAHFGESVATAGDVNGDGYSDVIVGAHGYDNGETDEGRAFVYLGSSVDLLRNDETSQLDPASPPFASIFTGSGTNSLDALGPSFTPMAGEGPNPEQNGSPDLDDLYVVAASSPLVDPDPLTLADSMRPLVFYQLAGTTAPIRVTKLGGQVQISW